jgi:hypothetical protein
MTTQITQLPPAPSRANPANFASLADSFVAALPTFGSQANQLAVEVNQNALSAQAAGNAVAWVSGSNPAQGTVVYDTTDFRSYRRTNQTISPGTTTRPGLTTQGWVRLTGQGDALVGSSNTFTATNTFNAAVTFNQPITVNGFVGLTGSVRIGNSTITGTGTISVNDTTSGTAVINCTASTTINPTISDGGALVLVIKRNSNTVTINSVTWLNNTIPNLSATGATVLVLWRVGGVTRGFKHGDYAQ